VLTNAKTGEEFVGVAPVRAFPDPGADPRHLAGARRRQGSRLDRRPRDDAAEQIRALVTEELDGREFMPEILSIKGVSSFATPCTWTVKTDRGDTEFVLKGEKTSAAWARRIRC
jgi:hypothetical protein